MPRLSRNSPQEVLELLGRESVASSSAVRRALISAGQQPSRSEKGGGEVKRRPKKLLERVFGLEPDGSAAHNVSDCEDVSGPIFRWISADFLNVWIPILMLSAQERSRGRSFLT